MKTIKAVLFDKDGTLLEFNSIWLKVAHELVDAFVCEEELLQSDKNDLLEKLGVFQDGADPNGIIACGTNDDIVELFVAFLKSKGCQKEKSQIHQWVNEKILTIMKKYQHEIVPVQDVRNLLEKMKQEKLTLGIVTADSLAATKLFLEMFDLSAYFDFIVTSDTFPVHKPDPLIVTTFCQQYSIDPAEVAVVGDTPLDLMLAKNGQVGVSVGVLTGTGQHEDLHDLADFVLPSVAQLLNENQRWIWQEQAVEMKR
ncbi:haloacid dehalogenase [Bacillaceae bacterium SAOS 7]|nr:haloacid dehalogenase [Bacillaceae bacterium SAOS 7]